MEQAFVFINENFQKLLHPYIISYIQDEDNNGIFVTSVAQKLQYLGGVYLYFQTVKEYEIYDVFSQIYIVGRQKINIRQIGAAGFQTYLKNSNFINT